MFFQVLSIAGAIVILVAFAANQFKKMERDSLAYQLLNLLGGVALCITAVVERQYGFILLEGAWALISAWGVMQVTRRPATQ